MPGNLDRRVPTTWDHVTKYPLRRAATTAPVERILDIPRQYRNSYDQGTEGACVSFSQSWLMSILNRKLYSARTLYIEARKIDEWPGEDYEGTSLRAGFDVLRLQGHWRFYAGQERPVELDEGIAANRWAQSVDEVRASIADGVPVNLGINWYQEFDTPVGFNRDGRSSTRQDYYIGSMAYWGVVLGGHAITCVGASDRRQAFALCNTWGMSFPFLVWLPYAAFERLMGESGEAGVVTDR